MRLEQTALRVDQREIAFGELVFLARLSGHDRTVADRLARRIAAAKLAEAEGVTVAKEERERTFNLWRRRRDLIAADDYRHLLSAWGVDRAAVWAYIERCIAFDALTDRGDQARQVYEPSLAEILTLLPDELLFEGEWGSLIASVALHVVATPLSDGNANSRTRLEILVEAGLGDQEVFRRVTKALGVSIERAEWLIEQEMAFRNQRREVLAPEKLERELKRRRSELELLELSVVQTVDLDIANEVLCCVHLDDEPIERVASRASLSCQRETVLFKDLGQSSLGMRAAGARSREMIGPVEVGAGFAVGQLIERRAPSLDEPKVVAFLASRLLVRELGREVARRVRIAPEAAT